MKNKIILFSFLSLFSFNLKAADDIVRMPILDVESTEGMEYSFELKTPKFDSVVLDCQSFITGITFNQKDEMVANIYLDMFVCQDMVNYLQESKREKRPVCFELNKTTNKLTVSEEPEDKCE